MILKILFLAIIIKKIYLNYDFLYNKFIVIEDNKYPKIDNFIQYDKYLHNRMIYRIQDDLQIIKENFYIIGKLNTCYFRKIGVEKHDKIYLLDECKQKIDDLKFHLKYFSLSQILNILQINENEWNIYTNFKLKESQEYIDGLNSI